MSETVDKRRRADLDLFILALIESGVSTPYEVQKLAGISQGASIPALRRLVDGGFVRPEKAASRGRIDHQITPVGRKWLRNGWQVLVNEEPSGDLDADLRVALLALAVGGSRRAAVEYLRRSAAKKASLARLKHEKAPAGPMLAHWYSSLRADAAKSLRRAESELIRSQADDLPKSLSIPRGQVRLASRKGRALAVFQKALQPF